MAERPAWLVFTEPISARVLLDCGVVAGLADRLDGRLTLVDASLNGVLQPWAGRLGGLPLLQRAELAPAAVSLPERVRRRVDLWLDPRIGYYPTAIRLNLREGFHAERMAPGHGNWFLDSDRVGPLPVTPRVDRALERWTFGARRYVPSALLARMRDGASGVAFANLQHHTAIPFLAATRRLRLPSVAYVASWDHTVGKGVIPPFLGRYVVQNEAMRDDLARHHRIGPERVVVTGWPQADVFARPRPREAYEALLAGFGLDSARPLVVYMGNTPTNMPCEGLIVERLVDWWAGSGARDRLSLLVRPHPRDREWESRFAAARGLEGAHVQPPSYADLEQLATLLAHCGPVVTNAGTILLDALVNDRPVVCVVYDEGEAAAEAWAAKSVVGEHYRELRSSGAFLTARSFDELTAGIERSLARPDELAAERRAVVRRVVGEVDGHAAERAADALAAALGARP